MIEAERNLEDDFFAALVFVKINRGKPKRRTRITNGRGTAEPFVRESTPAAFQCTYFDKMSNIARFPGFKLSIGTNPLEGYIDYYSKILHPARQETTIACFDEAGTRIHTTSDIELTADQITIRDNSGRTFMPTYTPEAHWPRTDP
ncbi:Uncharacterized protein HZ326_24091 [Fusarium oxysporum f. sp. albedinis]|nr:Uncharacterized protein HZ326_24091 [Fusarium oxysporum f. sp. albedinis]